MQKELIMNKQTNNNIYKKITDIQQNKQTTNKQEKEKKNRQQKHIKSNAAGRGWQMAEMP